MEGSSEEADTALGLGASRHSPSHGLSPGYRSLAAPYNPPGLGSSHQQAPPLSPPPSPSCLGTPPATHPGTSTALVPPVPPAGGHLPLASPWEHLRKTQHSPHMITRTTTHADHPRIPASPCLIHPSSPPPDLGEAVPSPGHASRSPPNQTDLGPALPNMAGPQTPEDKLVVSWVT